MTTTLHLALFFLATSAEGSEPTTVESALSETGVDDEGNLRLSVDGAFAERLADDLHDPAAKEVLALDIPSLEATLSFEEAGEVSWFPGSRSWKGRITDSDTDEILVTTYQDAIAGYLNVGGREFSIRGVVGEEWTLIERTDEDTCGTGTESRSGGTATGTTPTSGITSSSMMISTSSNLGSGATTYGPYAGVDNVVDLLAVYGQPAIDDIGTEAAVIAAIISGVATTNDAFTNSDVDAAIRIVGIENIGWDSSSNNCDARDELYDETYGAAGLGDLRDDYGADVVLGITGRLAFSTHGDGGGGTGCAKTVELPGPSSSNKDTNHAFTVRVQQTDWSVRHEFGHAAGLWHDRDEDIDDHPDPADWKDVEPYAYGYQWPDDLVVSDPTTLCTGEGFRTIMAKDASIDIGGTSITTNRINWFSNPAISVLGALVRNSCPPGPPPPTRRAGGRMLSVASPRRCPSWRSTETPRLSSREPPSRATRAATRSAPLRRSPGPRQARALTTGWRSTTQIRRFTTSIRRSQLPPLRRPRFPAHRPFSPFVSGPT